MKDLFSTHASMDQDNAHTGAKPLADRLRPKDFVDVKGQEHLFGDEGMLTRALEAPLLPSLIFWGPPGCGKTTIAKILAQQSHVHFEIVSAVTSNVAELKKIFARAQLRFQQGENTLLLVDEIHRFNRSQQDIFLPYIEEGSIILIGATTENPSFELNSALLSRCKVVVLNRLETEALLDIIARAEAHYDQKLPLMEDAKRALCAMADGDGRYLLGLCEELFSLSIKEELDTDKLVQLLQKRLPHYDKHQDSHYNLISALHKSLRGSDVDAALYWLGRMLNGGEEPLYIIRRLVRFAVEDIGLADPEAVHQANAAKDVYTFLGSPEGELAIAQAVVYLATAPKSNAVYSAFKASMKSAKTYGSLMPPKHILNAPTSLMKSQGYGEGYQYDHDSDTGFSGQNYFPVEMRREHYYHPPARGFEREIIKRLDYWEKLRNQKQNEEA